MALKGVLATSLAFGLAAEAYPSEHGNLSPRQTPKAWQPAVNTSWNYQIGELPGSNNAHGISVWDIDLFDSNRAIINGLQANGAKVICYFSAGSSENWRPDYKNFTEADQGSALDGWEGERWVDTNSQNVRDIMSARLQMAAQKNCDGVDPDNMDAYNNGGGGLGLTQDDAVDYALFLASTASSLGLSIGLKNAGEIVPRVVQAMQWSVNEQCIQYEECDLYAPFIRAEKPVFNVEYPKGDTSNDKSIDSTKLSKICNQEANDSDGFSTIVKNLNLDAWIEFCNATAIVLS
ncbi:hypothetical protein MMC10_003946 [Thelotrema lepadinum]|nr:hypothetical protein [Thelotrema lepadinum]